MALTKLCEIERIAKLGTNTIICRKEAGNLKHQFAKYGEVCRIDPVEAAAVPSVSVTFYDVRAASLALRALKPAQGEYCKFGVQKGERNVRLPGDANISAEVLLGVSNFGDEDDEGYQHMEFFDIRDAERAKLGGKQDSSL